MRAMHFFGGGVALLNLSLDKSRARMLITFQRMCIEIINGHVFYWEKNEEEILADELVHVGVSRGAARPSGLHQLATLPASSSSFPLSTFIYSSSLSHFSPSSALVPGLSFSDGFLSFSLFPSFSPQAPLPLSLISLCFPQLPSSR